jgi:hypothetical protein
MPGGIVRPRLGNNPAVTEGSERAAEEARAAEDQAFADKLAKRSPPDRVERAQIEKARKRTKVRAPRIAGRLAHRPALRRDGAGPGHLPQARAHDGWRRNGGKRSWQGIGLYGASTGRTRKIGSRLRAANPARCDVLFLIYEGRRHVRGRPPTPDSEQFRSGPRICSTLRLG